jgi:hypothetical protein
MTGLHVAPTAPRASELLSSSVEHESFHSLVGVVLVISRRAPADSLLAMRRELFSTYLAKSITNKNHKQQQKAKALAFRLKNFLKNRNPELLMKESVFAGEY